MTSRRDQKERLRAEREAREREAAAGAARRRRLGLLGGAAALAAVIVVALILISSGGGDGGKGGGGSSGGGPVQGASEVNGLLRGIPQAGISLGKPNAPVTMVEFADLQCPFCGEYATNTLPTLVRRYVRPGKVRLELRLIAILGPDSAKAHEVAAGAAQQNLMWNFSELFYRNQGQENTGYVTDSFLRSLVAAIPGLDSKRVFAEAKDAASRGLLDRNRAAADTRGVDSTPSFFAGKTGQSLAPLQVSSLDASVFASAFDQLLSGR